MKALIKKYYPFLFALVMLGQVSNAQQNPQPHLLGENPNNVVQIETINNNEGKPKGTKVSIFIKIKNATS